MDTPVDRAQLIVGIRELLDGLRRHTQSLSRHRAELKAEHDCLVGMAKELRVTARSLVEQTWNARRFCFVQRPRPN
jgi:hypothetical protein